MLHTQHLPPKLPERTNWSMISSICVLRSSNCPRTEDRKIRKKEQNKNAATRYRQKKKLEMENVLGEEHVLSKENEQLRRTLQERRNEMRYLRQLIR
uniref:BZIP domain-containing protein n=1 Tax=Cyprinus carpio TaxID=7962 RepID=A0A8C2Q3C1_CYPCA